MIEIKISWRKDTKPKFPRLVTFANGKFGVEVRKGQYADMHTEQYTWESPEHVAKWCAVNETSARGWLANWPFPARPVEEPK